MIKAPITVPSRVETQASLWVARTWRRRSPRMSRSLWRQPSEPTLIQQRRPEEEAPTPALFYGRPLEVRSPVDQHCKRPADRTTLTSRDERVGERAASAYRFYQVGGPRDRESGAFARLKRAYLEF